MFKLVHRSVSLSSNVKQLNMCNVCIGLNDLNKSNFPEAIHSHTKNCILGVTLSWYSDNTNSLLLQSVTFQNVHNITELKNLFLQYLL